VVDCGGLGIKAGLLDDEGALLAGPTRHPTPYPLTPDRLAELIICQANELLNRGENTEFIAQREALTISRATIGMPGMIRGGKVVYTPHYITTTGPHSPVDPNLLAAWSNLDFQMLLEKRLGCPVRVINDAELHGYGVISGVGAELVLTFGTGLGAAWFQDGVLAPHLELSHAPVRIGAMIPGHGRKPSTTFDQFIGDHELKRLGSDHWSDRVLAVVDALWPVFRWDQLYLGGGNAANIATWALAQMPTEVNVIPNESAFAGGAKLRRSER
jgi:polyphosphate glucokinase